MAMRLFGTVVTFDAHQKFGLIRPDGWIKEIVVRKPVLEEAGYPYLNEGDRVEFAVMHDDRYIPIAVELERLSPRWAAR